MIENERNICKRQNHIKTKDKLERARERIDLKKKKTLINNIESRQESNPDSKSEI